ncbi:MAG: hypothetical protein CMI12_07195 [Oceanospirillum sp.]|nr:hypothetical protein [Oceanospirillum sp.]
MLIEQRRLQIQRKLHSSNRKQLIFGLLSFIVFTVILIKAEGFEAFYEYSRSHEDWDLDEWILGLFSALFIGSLTFAYSTWRYNRILNEEIEYQAKLEQELAHAQKMQSLGTLAGGIAHSTNNHLQPIQTLSRLSKKQLPEDHALQPVLDKILLASEHAQEVLNQLLRFSHQDNREKPICDLSHEIRHHETLYRSVLTHPDQLSFDITDKACTTGLTTSQSADIILALITNAEDSYLGQAGPIQVILQQSPQQITLSVCDQGCGMDRTQQQRIFEPFYTSKAVGQGTGLGLSIVHGLVQQAGGTITVQSEQGKGSHFVVKLPLIQESNL